VAPPKMLVKLADLMDQQPSAAPTTPLADAPTSPNSRGSLMI
jgi:hypothetical protein